MFLGGGAEHWEMFADSPYPCSDLRMQHTASALLVIREEERGHLWL